MGDSSFRAKESDFQLPKVETTDHVEVDEHLVLRPEYVDDSIDEILGPTRKPTVKGGDEGPALWVRMPNPPRPTADVLWHYTDGGGAIGVMESNQLWATALTSLNDTEEFAFAQPILKNLLDRALSSRHLAPEQKAFMENCVELAIASSSFNPLYVCCASEQEDSLAQWRAYGEAGYAIGIANTPDLYGVVVDSPERPRRVALRGPWPSWSKVVYDEPGQTELLAQGLSFCAQITPDPRREELIPGMTAHQGGAVLAGLLCYCKHPAFSVEEEVRLVAITPLNSNAVRHRPSRYGVAPYVRLAMPADRPVGEPAWWTVAEHQPLPVRKVLVGPGPAAESAHVGMKSLVLGSGHLVDVVLSNAPYR